MLTGAWGVTLSSFLHESCPQTFWKGLRCCLTAGMWAESHLPARLLKDLKSTSKTDAQ